MGQRKQDLHNVLPLVPIRVEREFLEFPIHTLGGRGKTDKLTVINIQGVDSNGKEYLWRVTPNVFYGVPGETAYKIDRLYIDKLIDKFGAVKPKIIPLGSLNDIAESTGANKNSIKKALKQSALAGIEVKKTIKTRNGVEKTVEGTFTRYSVIFTGEKFPDGKKADQVYLIINDPWLDILNSIGTRPLNYEYLKILSPISQRFYEVIHPKVFACFKYNLPFVRYKYSDFCLAAPQTRYYEWEKIKKQMYKVLKPHKDSLYIQQVDYKNLMNTSHPDWEIHIYPGDAARKEYEIFTEKGVSHTPLEQPTLALDTLNECTLASPVTLQQQAKELVSLFWYKKGILKPKGLLKKDIQFAQHLLEELGEEKAQFCVDWAVTRAKNPPPPELFGGIKTHLTQAIAAYEAERKAKKQKKLSNEISTPSPVETPSEQDLIVERGKEVYAKLSEKEKKKLLQNEIVRFQKFSLNDTRRQDAALYSIYQQLGSSSEQGFQSLLVESNGKK